MADYTKIFTTFGAELQVLQKTETFFRHCHDSSDANYSKRLLAKTNSYDPTVSLEAQSLTRQQALLQDSFAPAVAAIHNADEGQLVAMKSAFFPILDRELLIGVVDQELRDIAYVYDTTLTDGTIGVQDRRGRFGALHRAMTTDGKKIKGNVVTIGSLTASPANHGTASLAAGTGEDHTLTGVVSVEISEETIGQEKATVALTLTTPLIKDAVDPGASFIGADNSLTFGKSFGDGPTGLRLALNLGSVVESGDDGNIFSSPVFTGINATDLPNRKVFIDVHHVDAAPTFEVKAFSDSAQSVQIGSTVSIVGAVGVVSGTITGTGGMVLTFDFDKAAAIAHLPAIGNRDNDIVFDPKLPRLGDKWTIAVTNNEAGNFATKIAKRFRASLVSVTDGTENVSEALAATITMS